MFFQRPRSLKTRSKARRQFEFAQRFPTCTLGQKINLVWGKKSPVTHRKNFKEFLDFPKIAQQHSRGSCVRWKRCIKPKIDQQISGTRSQRAFIDFGDLYAHQIFGTNVNFSGGYENATTFWLGFRNR